jgi:hypothetical protein
LPDGPCEELGLGREDALGELEGLPLDMAAAGNQSAQESRFSRVGDAFGSLILTSTRDVHICREK